MSTATAPTRAQATAIGDELIALRRALHADPEVGLRLPRTQRRILDALAGLGLEITTGTATTSVTAVLRGGAPGPTVLLRGDMDALPIVETTGLPFAAANGAMHACGHDLHVAGLVGAARLLAARRAELAGSVLFMFQPGEEGHGGARVMIEEGVLDAAGEPPVAAYGVHVAADLPAGLVTTRPGPLMAGYSLLDVTVRGRGGHGSRPHHALDPVPVAAEIITALQTYVTRRFDVFDPVVITVGEVSAGTAPNVIPETARLRAGVRAFSATAADRLAVELPHLARHIATGHGLSAEVEYGALLPVTVNDEAAAARYAATAIGLFGAERYRPLPNPRTGSEDFSLVLQRVPGSYGFLGAAPPTPDDRPIEGNHSPNALFDDSVLPDQAALLTELALGHLVTGHPFNGR
ncbi:M20 metallopeptidase family protein [Streptomyces millisiae]|uniref:M20 family metallopeptidase n=1 Tax=Streptomyces millisiae TaxID=3075542 RepID=A0ABU2LM71_9ACTN|nr:M20 family metallopeptidase [Streptomyces sp. DSM 44918]MDT0318676.1 M20 family metallopeptidase [Streptomyces sp. DSM 44918]